MGVRVRVRGRGRGRGWVRVRRTALGEGVEVHLATRDVLALAHALRHAVVRALGRYRGYMGEIWGRSGGDLGEIRPDLDVDADAAGAGVLDDDRHALAVRRELEHIQQQPALGPRRARHLVQVRPRPRRAISPRSP